MLLATPATTTLKGVSEDGKSVANLTTLFLWVQNSLKHLLKSSAYLFYK